MTPSPIQLDDEFRPPPMSYAALFARFLRFGLLAFGGPVAQIAMIRQALVEEERWISPAGFNRLLAVMQALPGPEAHELCVHLGVRAKGRLGGLLAGLGFMVPGLLLMLALAWAYTSFAVSGEALAPLFLGAQAVMLTVLLTATIRIGRHVLEGRDLVIIGAGAAAASFLGLPFWLVIPLAGAAAVLRGKQRLWPLLLGGIALTIVSALPDPATAALQPAGAATPGLLFLAGLKAGLLTFGGAYTAIPFVRADTVGRGWLSDGQFLDGLAFSSLLPAPLVIFATFAGWVSGGPWGALAITAGIFLPAFAFSLLFYERLERLADHPPLRRFLAGVAAAVVGLIAVTLLDLCRSAFAESPDPFATLLLAVAALPLLLSWRRPLATPLALFVGALAGLYLFDQS
jgi:chromate transporter